jgi:HD-like signal output (HDOD) protein
VSKGREQLSANEIVELRSSLAVRLEHVGVQSQPQVALKILDLIRRPDSQLKDYATIVRNDPALSGRLLKLANSAFFAQRKPVTNLDRACLLMGIDRLKAMALGFHLSKAAASDPSAVLSRTVWGQSIFRACLAAEIAKKAAPGLSAEAFIIGLLMDSGIALMPKLAGEAFQPVWDGAATPIALHRAELSKLPFGHVDVAAAMALAWRLPDILRWPISEHHTPPAMPLKMEPAHQLHAIAYAVGLLDLSATADGGVTVSPGKEGPTSRSLERTLGIDVGTVPSIVNAAAAEYGASKEIFKDVAASMAVTDSVLERIQVGMVNAMDDILVGHMECRAEKEAGATRFKLGGQSVELQKANDGSCTAFLYDSQGQKLLTHVFKPVGQSTDTLREALALDAHPDDEASAINAFIKAA